MIIRGDCLEKLQKLAENSVDAVVTDPPYGWRFMGKAWDGADIEKMAKAATGKEPRLCADGRMRKPRENCASIAAGKYDLTPTGNVSFQVFTEGWAREAFRVLKPGGHMLVFCGPRTYHRMACGVEDAGFEVRDQLQWLFGSGFPKSHDISKQIDKQVGAEREVLETKLAGSGPLKRGHVSSTGGGMSIAGTERSPEYRVTAPATNEAKQWQGWGTALKPANEPIVLARKPLSEKTVAANVLKWNTGGLNIDKSRIQTSDNLNGGTYSGDKRPSSRNSFGNGEGGGILKNGIEREYIQPQGRFPANLLLDECAAEMLDLQSGVLHSRPNAQPRALDKSPKWYENKDPNKLRTQHDISGGASRFFYVAKSSKRERNAGLEGMPTKTYKTGCGGAMPIDDDGNARDRFQAQAQAQNTHPTVKPIKLMEYLIKLITPPGGIVLDPFMGSGSTGVAAKRLGFEFIGIEMNEEYCEIAEKRIDSTTDAN